MADPPAINSLLQVVIDDELGFPTRVEELDGPILTIAAPLGRGDLEVPAPGTELQVIWTASRTRYMWQVEMLSRTKGRLNRWHLRGLGDPQRHNRRQYVRGEASGPVTLVTTGRQTQAKEFTGYLIDVCEGGARCRLRRVETNVGEAVALRLSLDRKIVQINGMVLLVRAAEDGRNHDVVVTYDLKEREAQLVRRYVLQWEITERHRLRDLGRLPVAS